MPLAYDSNLSKILLADEWKNFLARIGRDENTLESELSDPNDILELRFWASYRGQTLARTGRYFLFVFIMHRSFLRGNFFYHLIACVHDFAIN